MLPTQCEGEAQPHESFYTSDAEEGAWAHPAAETPGRKVGGVSQYSVLLWRGAQNGSDGERSRSRLTRAVEASEASWQPGSLAAWHSDILAFWHSCIQETCRVLRTNGRQLRQEARKGLLTVAFGLGKIRPSVVGRSRRPR